MTNDLHITDEAYAALQNRPKIVPGDEDNHLAYRVDYRLIVEGDDSETFSRDRRSARVDIYPGYTTFADIPKIIAAKHGMRANEVIVYSVDLVKIVRNGVKR